VVKSAKKKKSIAGQFAIKYKLETYCWTQKLNKEDYGFDKYRATSCCCKRVDNVVKQ
jgi:hypothetical protein